MEEYLTSVRKQFEYYKLLGDKTFAQVSDEALFWQYNEDSNSIATIVRHLSGNMRSRWTDFLISDGEKEWRHRDSEFENPPAGRADMIQLWEQGWKCLFEALDSLNASNWDTTIYIRNQGHTVMEAINRQLAHYPYHIGQIIFIGKMVSVSDWQTLSIARGHSNDFNKEKFAREKHQAHFTDEFLKPPGH